MKDYFNSSEVKQDKNAKTLSYFCMKDQVLINRDIIRQLINESRIKGNCDVRISLHKSPSEDFHNMIILQNKNNYYRPHKHRKKVEAYQIITGKMAVFIFDDNGEITESHVLDPEDNFIFRIAADKWHVSIPLTDIVVFHESKPGPFIPGEDSIFPEWAPYGSDPHGAMNYFASLLKKINSTERK